jgi:hypothetical protein
MIQSNLFLNHFITKVLIQTTKTQTIINLIFYALAGKKATGSLLDAGKLFLFVKG